MIYCCAGIAGYHHHHLNSISFENLKTRYALNEDIIVDYVIRDNVQSSTRDWIGIFPRGWTNLQQYLTFEYALVAPGVASVPNRTIIFIHTFHKQASLNTEYQLVYVSKQIQVMATSAYFRFSAASEVPKKNQPICRPEACAGLPGYLPCTVMSDQSLIKSKESSMTLNEGPTSTYSGRSLPLMPSMMKNLPMGTHASLESRRICRHCNRPMTNSRVAAGRARFLASHNNSLMGRVGRLERDLGLAEGSLRHARMVRANLVNRLQAYEAFVAEMLRSLAVKGMVKIMDASGKEIILRRVNPESSNKEVETILFSEAQKREDVLTTVIERQERIIRQLVEDRNRHREAYKNSLKNSGDSEFQATVDLIPEEENLFFTKKLCDQDDGLPTTTERNGVGIVDEKSQVFAHIKTQTNVTDTRNASTNESTEIPVCVEHGKSKSQNTFDVVSVSAEHEELLVEPTKDLDSGSLSVKSVEKFEGHREHVEDESLKRMRAENEIVETRRSNEIEGQTLVLADLEMDQRLKNEPRKVIVPTIQGADSLVQEEIRKEGESSKILLENRENRVKPSAIVIQGDNIKFAIIRY